MLLLSAGHIIFSRKIMLIYTSLPQVCESICFIISCQHQVILLLKKLSPDAAAQACYPRYLGRIAVQVQPGQTPS
jgi:hypothetical protein